MEPRGSKLKTDIVEECSLLSDPYPEGQYDGKGLGCCLTNLTIRLDVHSSNLSSLDIRDWTWKGPEV